MNFNDSSYYKKILLSEIRKYVYDVSLLEGDYCMVNIVPYDTMECKRFIREYCEFFGTAFMDESNDELLLIGFCGVDDALNFYESIK